MTFDTTGKISIAQLAFFLAVFLPSQYVLFKHRKTGFFGWLFICLFCIIRIVGAAIIIHDEAGNNPISEAGAIISSVAVAPMIIAISGIAHESFGSIEHLRPLIFGWAADLLIHSITIGAIVILVFGYLKLEGTGNSASEMKTGLDLVKAGGLVLLLVWVMIAAIVLASFTHRRALRGEKQLAGGVVVATICLLVRILYLVLEAFINTGTFRVQVGGTVVEKVILDVLPEFILVLTLLAVGIAARNLKHERDAAQHSKDHRYGSDSHSPAAVEEQQMYRK